MNSCLKHCFLLLISSLLLNTHGIMLSAEQSQEGTPMKLLSVSRLWNEADHNAFTDLIDYQGSLFCCFREADEHAGGKNGSVRILKSGDGEHWEPVAVLFKEGVDLRDPKFSVMPDGRLMVNIGGSLFKEDNYIGCNPLVAFSSDGISWSAPESISLPEEWIWGTTWHQNIGYGISYHITDPTDFEKPWIIKLFKTQDGKKYTPVTQLEVPDFPSEAVIRFQPDGTMIALVRRDGNGWIGSASAPYTSWQWSEIGSRLGGPNFLILPDGRMVAGSRLSIKKGKKTKRHTAVGMMTLTSYKPEIILPSDGDTGYPGMVVRDGILYVTYYSSHEKKTSIYLAKIAL